MNITVAVVPASNSHVDGRLIAKGVVQAFIRRGKDFSYQEVKSEILKRDGVMRVATCFTVSDYLEEFKQNGVLRFFLDKNKGHFCVLC
ncbi:MAG: hypothetical protein ACOYMB_03305 [Patescibacteria group bacterium]